MSRGRWVTTISAGSWFRLFVTKLRNDSSGLSRPWPDALHALTGQREMDATAIVDYYRPLKVWLDEENRGRSCGW